MKPNYDVIVVGAGPAGSVAAERLARTGLTVALIERHREVGVPSHCAGIIRRDSLRAFDCDSGPWIRRYFDEYRLVAPDGGYVTFCPPERGALIARHQLDQELARRAVAAGAELFTSTPVVNVITREGRAAAVVVTLRGEQRQIGARMIVAADGVVSRVARLAGHDSEVPSGGLAVAVKAVLEHPRATIDECQLHLGRTVAPGGYLWLLPRGIGVADIGVGINPLFCGRRKPLDFVHEFVARRFPGGTLRDVASHALSCVPIERPFAYPGLVLAGEAARQTNPVTGAGIFTAMSSGALAATAVMQTLDGTTDEASAMRGYQTAWEQRFGGLHQQSMDARKRLDGVDDDALCAAMRRIGQLDEHRSVAHAMIEVANEALGATPPACVA